MGLATPAEGFRPNRVPLVDETQPPSAVSEKQELTTPDGGNGTTLGVAEAPPTTSAVIVSMLPGVK